MCLSNTILSYSDVNRVGAQCGKNSSRVAPEISISKYSRDYFRSFHSIPDLFLFFIRCTEGPRLTRFLGLGKNRVT